MHNLLYLLAKSSALLTIFLIAFYFIRNDNNFKLNRSFLLGGIITSAILPFIYFTRIISIPKPVQNFTYSEVPVQYLEIAPEQQISITEILTLVYLLGVTVMLGRFLLQLFSIFKIINSAEKRKKSGFNLIETSREISPFSFLNYIIYNPSLHSEKDLEIIICHEKIHIQEHHTLDMILSNLNLIVQWCNPLAWLYHKNIQQNLEFLADGTAITTVDSREAYQKTLVQISVKNFTPGLTNNFYQSLIKKRIVMLNKKITTKRNGWKVHLMFPVLMLFMMSFNVKTKTVYSENSSLQNNSEITSALPNTIIQEVEMSAGISMNSSKESLKRFEIIFAKRNIELDFEELEYNSAGILTKLSMSFKNNNKKNEDDGIYNTEKSTGINDFEIYVDKKNNFGIRKSQKESVWKIDDGVVEASVRKIGNAPMFIIDGKQYSTEELSGKIVRTENKIDILESKFAIKEYGQKGKDGAIIITDGKIMDNMQDDIAKIDASNDDVTTNYVQIKSGTVPMFIRMVKDASPQIHFDINNKNTDTINQINGKGVKTSNNTSWKTDDKKDNSGNKVEVSVVQFSTNNKEENDEQLKSASINGNPLIFINGKKQPESFSLDNLDVNSIKMVNVVKGADPVKVYGQKAKDGLILITTKELDSTQTSTFVVGKGVQVGNINKTSRNNESSWTTNSSKEKDSLHVNSSNSNENVYTITRKVSSENQPLFVIDGITQKPGYNANDLDKTTIDKVLVLKGKAATKKYGEKGKNGVIEITTKI